jgi:hypothetical protein
MKSVNNVRVGKPQTRPSALAHTRGVHQGNAPGGYEKQSGHLPDGRSTAARSTGVNAEHRNPIDPKSPNLSPA